MRYKVSGGYTLCTHLRYKVNGKGAYVYTRYKVSGGYTLCTHLRYKVNGKGAYVYT